MNARKQVLTQARYLRKVFAESRERTNEIRREAWRRVNKARGFAGDLWWAIGFHVFCKDAIHSDIGRRSQHSTLSPKA